MISQGQLKCVGSSLYLKIKCGVGYHLRHVEQVFYFAHVVYCVNSQVLEIAT